MNRKYDLNYLEWLQKNSRLYMMALTALTLFIVISWCLYFEPWQPKESAAFWQNDSDQTVMEQQIVSDETAEESGSEQTASANLKYTTEPLVQKGNTQSEPKSVGEAAHTAQSGSEQLEIPSKENEKEVTGDETKDLLAMQNQLDGFAVPCSGTLYYGYGFGYNPFYDDYRFQDHLCYYADGAEVKSAANGVIQHVDLECDWQIVLSCGDYQICYQGLQTCNLREGAIIEGGQTMGTAEEYLKVKMVKQTG